MSSFEINHLEQFLFSNSKEDFLLKLVSGTENFYYFSLIHAINNYGLNLSNEQLQIYEKYKQFKSIRSQNIHLRYLFLQLSNSKLDELAKSKIFEELNKDFFNLKFDYEQPKLAFSTKINTVSMEIPNKYDEKLYDWQDYIEKSYDNYEIFKNLEPRSYSYLDTNKILKSGNLDLIKHFLYNANLADFNLIEELIIEYTELNTLKNVKYEKEGEIYRVIKPAQYCLENIFFKKLTKEQMIKLGELKPELYNNVDFFSELFTKEFDLSIEKAISDEEKNNRKKALLKMYKWCSEDKRNNVIYKSNFLFEILKNDLENNEFDFNLLIEYINIPNTKYIFSQFNKKHTEKLSVHKYNSNRINANLSIFEKFKNSSCISDDQLFEKYLTNYFKINKKIEPFHEYFNSDFLNILFNKVKIYEGEKISNLDLLLDPKTLKQIQEEKILSICNYNSEYFKDEVKLYIEIKNIPNLLIKVFEISLEDYYLKNFSEIDGSINLEGLNANEEIIFEFTDSPQIKKIKEFKFDNISNKKSGLFIIDFIGSGLSSRALIRKGKLLFIEKLTIAGKLLTILDENLENCYSSKRIGVWIQNKFHKANEKGEILIPFVDQNTTVPIILVNDDNVSLGKIELLSENYEFRCAYLFKDEQLLMGNKMKVLIQGVLYLNGELVNLDIIKNQSINVTTITESDIPSTISFDKINFDYKKEIEIEIQVPARLKKIDIQVKGIIKKMNSNEFLVDNKYEFQIKNHLNDSKFCGIYLRNTKDGYDLYVLGKNGEPKPNIIVSISLKSNYIKTNFTLDLQTNEEGKIILGKLNDILYLSALIKEKGDIKSENFLWNIYKNNYMNYPSLIHILENEKIILPYYEKELNNYKLSFLKKSFGSQNVIENVLTTLKIDKDNLEISNLQKGYYELLLKETHKLIKIYVHKGKSMKNSNFLILKNNLLESKPIPSFPSIKNIEINNGKLNFNIETDDPLNTRIHVLAYNFMNESINVYMKKLKSNIIQSKNKLIPNKGIYNKFYSNKTLSAEINYVLNRKKESRYVGNILQKPQINLKRIFTRNTNFENEILNQETNYKEAIIVESSISDNINFELNPSTDQSKTNKKPVSSIFGSSTDKLSENKINSFLNFLAFPGIVLTNINPNQNNKISIDNIIFDNYSTVEIIAINLNNFTNCIIPLENKKIKTRDLRQTSYDPKKNKFFSISRNTYNIFKNEKFLINDLASSELKIVDSLEKVFNLQLEFRKLNKNSDFQQFNYEKWKFLYKWGNLTFEQKQIKYDKFASHELNVFIFFKDKEFFEFCVKPFLQNKLKKKFIDNFLLENDKELQNYDAIQKINQMNILEKILFIIYLLKINNIERANSIVSNLKNLNNLKIYDTKTSKKYFDIVLGSRSGIDLKEIIVQPTQLVNNSENPLFGGPNIMNINNVAQPIFGQQNISSNMYPNFSNSQPNIGYYNQQNVQHYVVPVNSNNPGSSLFGGNQLVPPMSGGLFGGQSSYNAVGPQQPQLQYSSPALGLGMNGISQSSYNGMAQNVVVYSQAPLIFDPFGGAPQQPQYPDQGNAIFGGVQYNQPIQQQPVFNASFGGVPSGGLFGNSNNNFSQNQQQQQYIAPASGIITENKEKFIDNSYEQERKKFIQSYKNCEITKEYTENNYYNLINENHEINLIELNTFWVELASHLLENGFKTPFLSSKFTYCFNSLTSMISVLSFLTLPFESPNHKFTNLEGKSLEIQASDNLIIFQKEIKDGKSEIRKDIFLTQRFFDLNDRYSISEEDPQIKFEKDVDEYLIDKIYGCQIIITNCSVTKQEAQVLYKIPEGSLPILQNDYVKSTTILLNSFSTQTLEYNFYFPNCGKFLSYPANISKNGIVFAVAQECTFDVKKEPSLKTLDTMKKILSQGSKEDIIEFVETKNLFNLQIFSFSNIYYLLKDRDFFMKIVGILRKRAIYDNKIWSFSVYHKDLNTFKEFLMEEANKNIFGKFINYLKTDHIAIENIKFLEYYPLRNSRVHQISTEKNNILNSEFKNQYNKFLEYLVENPNPTNQDYLVLTYYLLLQDRIDDSIEIFNKIKLDNLKNETKLQYDYFQAYLDFYTGFPDFKIARKICEEYLDYPVISWRNLFYDIANQLAEYDGEELIDETFVSEIRKIDNLKNNEKSAKNEEMIISELNNNKEIEITSQNCSEIDINYYIIDLEVLYSRNPFLLQNYNEFSYIKPFLIEKIKIDKPNDLNNIKITIPEKINQKNVFILVKSGENKNILTYFSSSIKIQTIEKFAQIKVTNKENKPLSKVYVKVFSKNKSDNISFYKDGYTDIRGRFDYAFLNNNSNSEIKKFSIFIMSDEYGSLIKEVNPPENVEKSFCKVKLISNNWNQKAQQIQNVRNQNLNSQLTQKKN